MSDNINEMSAAKTAISEPMKEDGYAKAGAKASLEYILSRIEKLLDDHAHIKEALSVLSNANVNPAGGEPYAIAGKARMEAIADVVKCKETTIQQALSFYQMMYDELKPSPLDAAIAQAEKILNAPMYLKYHSPETRGHHERELHEAIMDAFKEGLKGNKTEESVSEFKKRVVMERINEEYLNNDSITPHLLAQYLAVLDNQAPELKTSAVMSQIQCRAASDNPVSNDELKELLGLLDS